MSTEALLEAILFWRGEPMCIKELASNLSIKADEVEAGLFELEKKLEGRGVVLVRDADEVALETASGAEKIIEKISKEELDKDIGRAGLETLSLILYRGPISRRRIDFVRGVNSSFILRNLMVRGLIERAESQAGERSFVYKPTLELLSYLGIKKREELPEFEVVEKELEEFERRVEEVEKMEKNENE